MLKAYLKHWWKAKNEHGIHSPFVFELYNEFKKSDSKFEEIEQLGRRFKKDSRDIEIKDLGAGSKYARSNQRSVASIASKSRKSAKWAKLMAKIIEKAGCRYIVELGTSLGFTTAYFSKTAPFAKIYTFEGCPNTLSIAKENFNALNCHNVTPILGNIDDTLPYLLGQIPKVDFVFFDANHQYEATMSYFRHCLSKAHEESCFVFDDIYWSKGMEQAWEEIKNHEKVTISLDFFQLGVVFFRQKQEKQHFVLKL